MTRRWIACAAVLLAAAGCSGRRGPEGLDPIDETESVSVDVQTLWKKEAASDPITAYRLKLAADPDNAALHNNLGNQYVLENRLKEALREFRAAARLDRGSPVPWNNLGTAYKKMGRTGAAMSAFQKCLRLDERYALAYYNIGTLHDQMGKYDEAIEHYLKAMALRPELSSVKFNPQVVENRHLMVVKLRHFLEESGNIALPLDRLPE